MTTVVLDDVFKPFFKIFHDTGQQLMIDRTNFLWGYTRYHDPPAPRCFNRKGVNLNTLERFYIHQEVKYNNHINNKSTYTDNRIFQTIMEHENV